MSGFKLKRNHQSSRVWKCLMNENLTRVSMLILLLILACNLEVFLLSVKVFRGVMVDEIGGGRGYLYGLKEVRNL